MNFSNRRAITGLLYFILPSIAYYSFYSCNVIANESYSESIIVDQIKYYYSRIKTIENNSQNLVNSKGKLILTDANTNEEIYKEITPLQPGCEGFSSVSVLNIDVIKSVFIAGELKKNIVVTCGNIDGRHMTAKLFFKAPNGIRTAMLDFENTPPNFTYRNGIVSSSVYRRLLFEDTGYSDNQYLFVYRLNFDEETMGFSVLFGDEAEANYKSYFESLHNNIDDVKNSYIGPLLAALYATNNKDYACKNLIALEKKIDRKQLSEWVVKLKKLNFPVFDVNTCKGN